MATETEMTRGRVAILAWSRALGWFLAFGVLIGATSAAVELRNQVRVSEAVGRDSARVFIGKVIACRRHTPRPHPSWAECERRVRAQD